MRKNESQRATNIACKLLKYRPRSEYELRSRLKIKNISKKEIDELIKKLKKANLIDDREFALFWIKSRIKKGYWVYRIVKELKIKGVSSEVYKPLLDKYLEEHHSLSLVRALIKKRKKRYCRDHPLNAKRKLFMYLKRRGFSYSDIMQALGDYDDF